MENLPENAAGQLPLEMVCLFCGGRMARGTSALESLWLDFFQKINGSAIGLFFRQRGKKRVGLFGYNYTRDAFYCDCCGTITIAGMRAEEVACPSCAHHIPPGTCLCRNCGKSYDPSNRPVEY